MVISEELTQPVCLPKQADGVRARDAVNAVLLALSLFAVALAFLNGLAASYGNSPQFSFTLAGSFAVFLATRPARRDIVVTLVLGLALRLAYGTFLGVDPYFGSALIGFTGVLGLVWFFTSGASWSFLPPSVVVAGEDDAWGTITRAPSTQAFWYVRESIVTT